jgi:hypothetical protein
LIEVGFCRFFVSAHPDEKLIQVLQRRIHVLCFGGFFVAVFRRDNALAPYRFPILTLSLPSLPMPPSPGLGRTLASGGEGRGLLIK